MAEKRIDICVYMDDLDYILFPTQLSLPWDQLCTCTYYIYQITFPLMKVCSSCTSYLVPPVATCTCMRVYCMPGHFLAPVAACTYCMSTDQPTTYMYSWKLNVDAKQECCDFGVSILNRCHMYRCTCMHLFWPPGRESARWYCWLLEACMGHRHTLQYARKPPGMKKKKDVYTHWLHLSSPRWLYVHL